MKRCRARSACRVRPLPRQRLSRVRPPRGSRARRPRRTRARPSRSHPGVAGSAQAGSPPRPAPGTPTRSRRGARVSVGGRGRVRRARGVASRARRAPDRRLGRSRDRGSSGLARGAASRSGQRRCPRSARAVSPPRSGPPVAPRTQVRGRPRTPARRGCPRPAPRRARRIRLAGTSRRGPRSPRSTPRRDGTSWTGSARARPTWVATARSPWLHRGSPRRLRM